MEPLIGHDAIVEMLDRVVREDRVRHAYLFAGLAHVGKATLARWLALRLNCTGAEPPCGECRTCRLIAQGVHPDVRALQLAAERDASLGLALDVAGRSTRSAEKVISIDQVRALQHDASLAPREARWKVYILAGADGLSLEAANCLLKTLEEPADRVVLILTVVDPVDLPETVVSRCQLVRLAPVPATTIADALQARHGCDSERATLLARLSGGRPGWAIAAAADPAILEERDRALDDLTATLGPGFRNRLGLAERLAGEYSRDPTRVLSVLELWHLYWWDVGLIQQGCDSLIMNVDRRIDLDTLAARTPASVVQTYVKRLGQASQRLLQNVNARLALETLLVTGPTIERGGAG